MDITRLWVDVALQLSEREFSIMDRFIQMQEKLYLPNYTQHLATGTSDNIVSIQRTAG